MNNSYDSLMMEENALAINPSINPLAQNPNQSDSLHQAYLIGSGKYDRQV